MTEYPRKLRGTLLEQGADLAYACIVEAHAGSEDADGSCNGTCAVEKGGRNRNGALDELVPALAVSLLPDVNLKLFLKPGREVLQGISLVLLLVHDSM